MKSVKILLSTLALAVVFIACDSSAVSLKTDAMQIDISSTGNITSIRDLATGSDYIAKGQSAPLLALRMDTTYVNPTAASWDETAQTLTLNYGADRTAKVAIKAADGYYTMELTEVNVPDSEHVDLALWGPYPTTISQTVGECVGVVRDSIFAFGLRALNTKTLGGYPSNEADIDPSFDIFATNSLVDVSDSVKILYRGQAAMHTPFGSVIQAYTRNRDRERVISMWSHDRYTAPALEDGGVIGSKIAIFGCPEPQALAYLEKIVIGEGMPHPTIDGVWNKLNPDAAQAYIIYPFNESNIEEAIAFTKRTGLKYLYHAGPFIDWGHFNLNPAEFPNGLDGLKTCVDKAAAEGIKLGFHTLSNFTTPNDKYVTPVPDKRLAKVGTTTLSGPITATQTEIVIDSPDFFNQMANNSLHGVMVGDELIRYEKVSDQAPWTLLGCQRGAWGTTAANHAQGENISKLMDHGYNVFLTDTDLTKEEARTLANIFNYTGTEQISFDGLEGAWSTGLGQYGLSIMMQEWWDNLRPELRNNINDASMTTHYNWYIFTRMNWGEPWYAGFRESQMNLRLMNQDFYRRNLIPCMLGWFKYDATTSIEDLNWLMARSAAFDAGYTLVTNPKAVAGNGKSDELIRAIREWENARLSLAFPAELKREMEHVANEYTLTETSPTTWDIYPYGVQRFGHKNVIRQPGEPVVSRWEFDNSYGRQPLGFIIKATDDISNATLAIGGYSTININGKLAKGEYLKYEGGLTIDVYDQQWNLLRSQNVDAAQLTVDPGKTTIVFGCDFASTDVDKAVSAEIKTHGEAQKLTAQRKR